VKHCKSLCSLESFCIFLNINFRSKHRQLRRFLKTIPHFTACFRYGIDVCNQCRKPSPLCMYEKWRRDNFRSVNFELAAAFKPEYFSFLTTEKYLKSHQLTQNMCLLQLKYPSCCITHFDKLLLSQTYTRSVCTYLTARPTSRT